tara:strand:- start:165 stop:491 length:327 start_codon:yes stop_codon:yes gene_type:complete
MNNNINVILSDKCIPQHWFEIANKPTKKILFGTSEEGFLGICKYCDYTYFFAKYLNVAYSEYNKNQDPKNKENKKPTGVVIDGKVIYLPTNNFPNAQEVLEIERPCAV